MDIEGAFNNVTTSAIAKSLTNIGAEHPIKAWIVSMLNSRVIHSNIGCDKSLRYASRGTPQGGVISPLLWLLVVNEILLDLVKSRIKVVAYADDVVILVSGLFLNEISDRVKLGLTKISKWAKTSGLGVNPAKTELVLFSKSPKTPLFSLPKINDVVLTLSRQAKYLGVIFDPQLSWKLNVEDRIWKGQAAFFTCRKLFSAKWGLSPKLIFWILKAVVLPILTYGAVVWWVATDVKNLCNKLDGVLRSVCIGITGALKSTSSDFLFAFVGLTDCFTFTRQIAARTALRLSVLGLWKAKLYGHSNILNRIGIKIKENIDMKLTSISFIRNFSVDFPSRRSWKTGFSSSSDCIIFTDGSKTETGCGAGWHANDCKYKFSYRLPDGCLKVTVTFREMSWLTYWPGRVQICIDLGQLSFQFH